MSCPLCGSALKTVPAGVSKKTGNAYDSFVCCSNRDCNYKPPKPRPLQQVPMRAADTTPTLPPANRERLIYSQTCIKAAVEFYAGTAAQPADVFRLAEAFYRALRQVEGGATLVFDPVGPITPADYDDSVPDFR